jgi:hypothetical protein
MEQEFYEFLARLNDEQTQQLHAFKQALKQFPEDTAPVVLDTFVEALWRPLKSDNRRNVERVLPILMS